MKLLPEFLKGLWEENPTFVLVLGMCPTLAVSTSVQNALGMGLATTFVLAGSNAAIALVRNWVPKEVRIPCYIVVIAVFVTVVDMLMKAYAPAELNKALGIFIPLIVVNCIVMGRAEAFASKNGVLPSLADGLGMGVGFTLALAVLGGIRELLGAGSLLGIKLSAAWQQGFLLAKLPPGAFITLGLLLGLMNWYQARKAARQGRSFKPPETMNCAHCKLCSFGRG
ncbi:MAG: electron transport complex subunit E [Lentisphaeria bacterium]|jgi:electron transport complex protein RnfE